LFSTRGLPGGNRLVYPFVIGNWIASQRRLPLLERRAGVNSSPDAGGKSNQKEVVCRIEQDCMEREIRLAPLLGGKAMATHFIEPASQCLQLHAGSTLRGERGRGGLDQMSQLEQPIENLLLRLGLENPLEDVGIHPVPLRTRIDSRSGLGTRFNQSLGRQHSDGFAVRGPRHAELSTGEDLPAQNGPWCISPGYDRDPNVLRNATVDASGPSAGLPNSGRVRPVRDVTELHEVAKGSGAMRTRRALTCS
jgi:hypothetical protein